MSYGVDILIVGLDTTAGWRSAADDLSAGLTRAGAVVRRVSAGPVPRVRTFMLTDMTQALLARRAAERGIAEHSPQAIIYFSVTAALLWPAPGAISLDSVAAENRPGRHGILQRPLERRRLREAPLLLPWSRRALEPLRGEHSPAVVVSPVVDPPATPGVTEREIDVVAYAGDPEKRRLSHILDVWQRARRDDETLVVAGHEDVPPGPGVRRTGRLSRTEFRALLRRAKVFVSAPRREDFGIAALEALAEGCMLVTTPAPGPYPALDLARALDPRLVGDEIGAALRAALDNPAAGYAGRALELLAPFGSAAVDATVATEVLPRLMSGSSAVPRSRAA